MTAPGAPVDDIRVAPAAPVQTSVSPVHRGSISQRLVHLDAAIVAQGDIIAKWPVKALVTASHVAWDCTNHYQLHRAAAAAGVAGIMPAWLAKVPASVLPARLGNINRR